MGLGESLCRRQVSVRVRIRVRVSVRVTGMVRVGALESPSVETLVRFTHPTPNPNPYQVSSESRPQWRSGGPHLAFILQASSA